MFAFAIYDQRKKRLFMARDRAGEKPLFYSLNKKEFRFSSELKGLMADPFFPKRINPQALDCYLAFGYVPSQLCILKGVNKLPPAHALTYEIETNKLRIWRYWSLPNSKDWNKYTSRDRLVEEFESLLEDSVKRQMIADVPVGILLSGGIDSSLVTAMAARNSTKIKTFTVRFPGYGMYDESAHARLVADYFATEHIELEASEFSADLFSILAKQYDEPLMDSSMIPTYLVCKLVKKYCTVALGGDGGDELFGGYNLYRRILRFKEKTKYIPRSFGRLVSYLSEKFMPLGMKGRYWIMCLRDDLNNSVPIVSLHFDSSFRKALLPFYECSGTAAERIKESFIPGCSDLIERLTRMDFTLYLPEDILVKVDRASMLNSLEVRSPILDYRIIEFAFSKVPHFLKTTLRQQKIIPKALARKILPPEFDTTRKQGFAVPLNEWLRKGALRFFKEVLLDPDCIFDSKSVKKLLKWQDMGFNNAERLFCLIMFELWRREYKVSV